MSGNKHMYLMIGLVAGGAALFFSGLTGGGALFFIWPLACMAMMFFMMRGMGGMGGMGHGGSDEHPSQQDEAVPPGKRADR